MTTPIRGVLDDLRFIASEASSLSVVPYSGKPRGAAVLLDTGEVVPGVRVESASFSLVIPAVVNAITTAVALNLGNVVAVAASDALTPRDIQYASAFIAAANAIHGGIVRSARPGVPLVGSIVSPYLLERTGSDRIESAPGSGASGSDTPGSDGPGSDVIVPESIAAEGIPLARVAARRAHVPESSFPVGCVAPADGGWVPGVNVEHPDWTLILCAERNLLGTLVSFGIRMPEHLFLSCPRDPRASPCGACRQLLSELCPEATIWSDRGSQSPDRSQIAFLLPGSFTGNVLRG